MSQAFRHNIVRSLFLSLWAMATLILLAMVILLVREIARNGGAPQDAFALPEQENNTSVPPAADRAAPTGTRAVQLFFGSGDDLQLLPETRNITTSGSTVENCRAALDALIKGPQSGGTPILPPTAKIKALFLLPHGELVINFSREVQAEHARLSSASMESLLVQGIAHTITQQSLQNIQDPKVRKVRILVEDAAPTEIFPAHIDISEPVAPDAQWLSAQG
ncbi:MAG: GerMN domain-containing protein [Candidatus Hydrogenedentes bacterium]|nr:GerMN domain-containing protein [Candidatus Hydrogenedentota bacterium]